MRDGGWSTHAPIGLERSTEPLPTKERTIAVRLVTRPLLNAERLAEWARGEGFDDLVPSAWHATVIRSDGARPLDTSCLTLKANPNRSVVTMGYFIALSFRSSSLARRHAAHRRAGGHWDFATYRPHVSFAIRDRRELREIQPYDGRLIFGPETMGW